MEETTDFTSKLEQALEQKREDIEKNILPDLKEQFRNFYNSYQSIYNILTRKSLIKEDPYKYEKKGSEVQLPSESPFLESEKNDELSIRLSDLDNQLDFLNSYYQFNLEFLTMQRIKLLASLTRYIRWDQVTQSSTNLNTRHLAEFLEKIKQGSDNLSQQIVNDALTQLSSISKQILRNLKTLTTYHREQYKLQIRRNILDDLDLDSSTVQSNEAEAMKQIKKKFTSVMSDQPFYEELIKEVLAEDYGQNSQEMQQEVLSKLQVKQRKKKKKSPAETYKTTLLEAVRTLASASTHLEEAHRKLYENNQVLTYRKMSLGEKLRQWLTSFGRKKEDRQIYEIEYFDTKTSLSKHERIDFQKFLEDVSKRAKVLANLSNKMSSSYQRLEASSEDQIFQFLNKNIQELQIILRRLPALDTYFKSEVSRELRSKIRGMKIEANAIKNSVVKANKKKYEYVSKKEETEQLKRLGVDVES
jgi:hypothetical protein